MPDIGQDLAMRDTVAAQAVGDEAPGFVLQPVQQSLEEALRRRSVPSALDQNVEHNAMLVDSTPEVMKRAVDPDEHLIQVPGVTWSWPAPAEPLGEVRA